MSDLLVRCLATDPTNLAQLSEPLMLQVGCMVGPFVPSITEPNNGYKLIKTLLSSQFGAGNIEDGASGLIYREEFDPETGRIIWVCCSMKTMTVKKDTASVQVEVEVRTEIEPITAQPAPPRVEAGTVLLS